MPKRTRRMAERGIGTSAVVVGERSEATAYANASAIRSTPWYLNECMAIRTVPSCTNADRTNSPDGKRSSPPRRRE